MNVWDDLDVRDDDSAEDGDAACFDREEEDDLEDSPETMNRKEQLVTGTGMISKAHFSDSPQQEEEDSIETRFMLGMGHTLKGASEFKAFEYSTDN